MSNLIDVTVLKMSPSETINLKIDPESTVLEVKKLIEEKTKITVETQKLIFAGQVLANDQKISFYKIQANHKMHLVVIKATQAQPQPQSQPQPTQPNPATAPNLGGVPGMGGMPFGGMGGLGGMPGMGGLGGMPGMGYGGFPPPQQIAAMMSNPVVQNTIQQMLQNPELIQNLLANNPLAQQLATNPQVAAALQNPDFYRQFSDPQTIQQLSQMYNNMFSGMGAMPGMGFGGFPQQPAPASTQSTTSSTGTAQPNPFAGIPLDPLISNLQSQLGRTNAPATAQPSTQGTATTSDQPASTPTTTVPQQGAPTTSQPGSVPQPGAVPQPGINPWAGLFPGMGMGGFAMPQPVQDPEQRFAVQLQQLNEMGFTNRQLNIQCLTLSNGNVDLAIERMLNG